MPDINYKQKYQELKQKYKNSVDTAFRLGYEQGQNDSQIEQAQQQVADTQAQQQAMAQGQGQPGQEGQPEQSPQAPDSAHPQGSELDQHISQLESMLGKTELTTEDLFSLKKSLQQLKFKAEMKKSDLAVKSIADSLKPKPAMSQVANHNLTDKAKNAISMQEQIVGDIMKTWEAEEKIAKNSITSIIAGEGLKKD